MAILRIGTIFELPRADYDQPPLITWEDFYRFRNHVLRVLRRFGSAGPMGEVDLSVDGEDDDLSFERDIVRDPDFFVVDDMYNKHDRLSIVECAPKRISGSVIEALAEMMQSFPGWWVSFSLGDSGLRISSDAVLVGGRRFWDCDSAEEIAQRCSVPVEFGATEPFSDSMYPLWISMISGGIDGSTKFPPAPTRQWAEVIRSLQAMRERRPDGRLTTFSYYEVRNDLHPETRRQLLSRYLDEVAGFPLEVFNAARRNILEDCGFALRESKSVEEGSDLAARIAAVLEAIADKLDAKEVVYWWAHVLDEIRDPSEGLTIAVNRTLRPTLDSSNPLLQLSSVFGLAQLHASDIASIVDNVMTANPVWSSNAVLMTWLGKLRTGSTSYPDYRLTFTSN
jgi:hypothetical protein